MTQFPDSEVWDSGGAVVVARVAEKTEVLGPGARAVVWVQGCPFRCRGCCSPDTLAFGGGQTLQVHVLADRLASIEGIEGVTLSGGEPFAQPRALSLLLDEVRLRRPELSAMSYSGYTLEALLQMGHDTRSLLGRLDILIDGQYDEARHAELRWRGSTNQRLHFLSDRYRGLSAQPDRSAGVEVWVDEDQAVRWVGVPPVPGFRPGLERQLAARGVALKRLTNRRPDE